MDVIQELIRYKDDLDAFSNKIPCMVHINSTKDFELLYADPKIVHRYLKHSKVDFDILKKTLAVVHPDDLEAAKLSCTHYLKHIDEYSTVSFLQRIASIDFPPYEYCYTTSIVIEELGGLVSFTVGLGNLSINEKQIDKIIDETNFIKQNLDKITSLTQREIEFIKVWLKLYRSDAIAKKMSITKQTVKSYKKRIYKKLNLNSFNGLVEFASAFDMVL